MDDILLSAGSCGGVIPTTPTPTPTLGPTGQPCVFRLIQQFLYKKGVYASNSACCASFIATWMRVDIVNFV